MARLDAPTYGCIGKKIYSDTKTALRFFSIFFLTKNIFFLQKTFFFLQKTFFFLQKNFF